VRLHYAPSVHGPALIEALHGAVKPEEKYVVISATEEAVLALSELRGQLPANVRLLFPEQETVAMLLDKRLFYERVVSMGQTISPMHFMEDWNEIPTAASIRFPCILKGRTKLYIPDIAKAYRLESMSELRATVDTISRVAGARPCDFVIQEWVPGTDADVVFCLQYYDAASNPKISFVGRKIRQWRPEVGGTASAAPLDDREALQQTTEFFRSVKMRGICSMEFKRSPADGKLYMIEPTACRADYQEGVAIANGYNVPLVAYQDCTGRSNGQVHRAARPVTWVHMGDDFAAASHYVSRGELTWWQWARSLRGPKAYAIYAREDPGPFVELMRRKMANRLRRLYS